MGDPPPTSSARPAPDERAEERLEIKPLTRRGYKRLPTTERQIVKASGLDKKALLERALQRDDTAPEYLCPEALVCFIRRADGDRDARLRDGLLSELLERCTPFFRGQFRGFDGETHKDLQQEVLKKVVEDILATDDRADFMEARFWKYMKCRVIDACRTASKHRDHTESLDTGYFVEGEPEGPTKLELEKDTRPNPEQLAIMSEGLGKLPPRLREVFVLRRVVRMAIGSDNPDDDPPDKLTLAREFGCSGRTIRNWLKEADNLLASFREKEDDEAK